MECKFIGVVRIKLFISGRKDFLYFDLPINSKIENLKHIISTMYNFEPNSYSLFHNNLSIDGMKGKTLEQLFKTKEICIIVLPNLHKNTTCKYTN